MKHKFALCGAAVLVVACIGASDSAGQNTDRRAPALSQLMPSTTAPSPAAKQRLVQEYGNLPLSFEANQGQTDPKVKFLSRGPGYQLFLLPNQAVLTIEERHKAKSEKKFGIFHSSEEQRERDSVQIETLSMALVGGARNARVTGIEEMQGKSNYFVGNDPAKWRTNVANYAKVRYHDVYPGIDLIYHGSQQQLEYDFVVAPGADAQQIRWRISGAKKLELSPEGDVVLATSGEPVRLRKPVIYQESGGKRTEIDGSFVLAAKNTVKFRVGKYDATQPLIIDPVLAYSTLLGGNGFDQAFGVAVDATGAYVTGSTTSTNFGTAGAFGTPLKFCNPPTNTIPCTEAFVAKLNPAGNALVYVAFLGGTTFSTFATLSGSQGAGVAVFGQNAYVTGTTSASDFPTTPGAFQTGLTSSQHAFVTELNATGSALVFSTDLGGTGFEFFDLNGGPPIAVDSSGSAYVTGTTFSSDFLTTTGAFQTDPGGGAFQSTNASATWTSINSGLTTRSITAFAVDPTIPTPPSTAHIVYAGTSDKEVFKSTNGGQSWAPTGALSATVVQAMVIDPRTPTNLYVGGANGAFKTTDGGATWATVDTGLVFPGTTAPVDVNALAIDPTTTGTTATLYAGGSSGVFKTTDGGATWSPLNAGFPLTNGLPTTPDVTSIVVDPVTPTTVYAGTSFQGVFKTTNGGTSWTASGNGLTFPNSPSFVDITALAIDAKSPNNIYATTQSGLGVFKTTNGAGNWSQVGTVAAGLTDLVTTAIVTDPTVSGTAYVGTESAGVFKTIDGGLHWTTSPNALQFYVISALAVDPVNPSILYAGSTVERPFVAKFGASGAIGYSMYLGGHSREIAGGIAVDGNSQAHVTGATESGDYPTTAGAFRTARQSPFDAFVTKLNAAGTALVYSTYLDGPNGGSEAFGIAVDTAGNAYVTGIAVGSSFPTTPGAFQTVNGGESAFVTKFSLDGKTLAYSTFLGAPAAPGTSTFDEGRAIAVDTNGNAWVTGITNDLNFPTVNPIRSSPPCGALVISACFDNPFVSEINPTGTSLLFSTYLGPTEFFTQGNIAVDSQGNAYVTGNTSFTDFPMVNPLPGTPSAGNVHGFVTKIANTASSADLSVTLTHTPPNPITVGQQITFTATVKNNGTGTATGVTLYPTVATTRTIGVLFQQFVSETATQGTCDNSEFCRLGTLAPGQQATATLVVNTVIGDEGLKQVAVGVGGNESDATPADNVATDTVNVLGAIDLRLRGTAMPAPVVVGTNLTYTLVVQNNGPSPATGVTLTDNLPVGVTFVSATVSPASQGSCPGTTTTVTCALGTLAALPGAIGATVTITVTPTAAGTITNNSNVTSNETNSNPQKAILQQISDVVAGTGVNNPLNARLKGPYGLLFSGALNGAQMAMAAGLVADGIGGLTGFADTNLVTGVTPNQAFSGSYNCGTDNRCTLIMNFPSAPAPPTLTLTFRAALGAFRTINNQQVATKFRFIEFDATGRTGAGFGEMQDPSALNAAATKGDWVFGISGQDAAAKHVSVAGRVTLNGVSPGIASNGLEDINDGGTVISGANGLPFTGTYIADSTTNIGFGRTTSAITVTIGTVTSTTNSALYIVTANEMFAIVIDSHSSGAPLTSGQFFRQATTNFTNAWLNGNAIANFTGQSSTLPLTNDVGIALLTADGRGGATSISDENNAGNVRVNHVGNLASYNVTANGRTMFFDGTGSSTGQPVAYGYDLNRAIFVGPDEFASLGFLEPQSGEPFAQSPLTGTDFFGDILLAPIGAETETGIATVTSPGNLLVVQDGSTKSGLIADDTTTNTFVVSPNGSVTFNDNSGGSGTVGFVASPNRLYLLDTKGSTTGKVIVAEASTAASAQVADLVITKAASVTQVVPGGQFFYTLTVKNNGPAVATGVTLTDTLPASLMFVSASATQGLCTAPPTGTTTVVCSLGGLSVGSATDIVISVSVLPTAPAGAITNTATVVGDQALPTTANNTVTNAAVTVMSVTDLAVLASATPGSVIVNSASGLTFEVTVVNVGNQPATNVVLTDTLPGVVTVVSSSPTGICTGTGTLSCTIGSLAAGASFPITIVVTPTVAGTVTNTATVAFSGTGTDPTPGDNTASASATVLPSAGTSERYLLADFASPNILEYDVATNTPQGTAHAGTNPAGIAISSNGQLAFVGNTNSDYVSPIDLSISAEIARIRGFRSARHLALSSDGKFLVVPNIDFDEVDIVDTSNFQLLKRVSLNGLLGDDPNNPSDAGLAAVVVVGKFAYINTGVGATNPLRIAVIDLSTPAFTASSIPGTEGFARSARSSIAATPDGRFVVIPRQTSTQPELMIIDTSTNTVSQAPAVANPFSIAITRNANDPNGVFGYLVQGGGRVSVVDLRPGTAFGQLIPNATITLPVNLNQGDIGITADGSRVIVTSFVQNATQNNVFVLDTKQLRTPPVTNTAILAQFHAGGPSTLLNSVAVGFVETQVSAVPVVTTVSPTSVANDQPRTIHITGSGFADGDLVRVGSMDPIAPNPATLTSTGLDVTLPQFAPAQNSADVIVTKYSVGVPLSEITGILRGALTITPAPAFQPANEVTVSAFGDNFVGILNDFTKSVTTVPTSANPFGEAISADGLRAYVGSFRANAVDVVNLDTKHVDTTIALAADTFKIGQIDAIATVLNPLTGNPSEYLLASSLDSTTSNTDLRLVIIDSSPTSPTFNTVVKTFNAGLTGAFPGALGVTSDGKFAYANDANTGNLAIFNVLAGTSTIIPPTALSTATQPISPFQPHIEVTSDNQSLLLLTNPGNLLVFDIGANPNNPVLVTTITGTPPAGLQPLTFAAFRVVGKRLFAFDGTQGVIQAFNFDRAASNFSLLGSFTIPGITSFFASGLAVTPDGALLYANLDQDDSVAVINIPQLLTSTPAASNPAALVTKLHIGLAPSAIVISPFGALTADLALTITASPTTVSVGTPVTYTITITNNGPSAATGVTMTDALPPELTFVSATPSQGAACALNTPSGPGRPTVTCSLGSLANGATATVSVTVTANSAVTGPVFNTATVAANETDPNPANNSASVGITITGGTACIGTPTIKWTGTAGDGQFTTAGNWNGVPPRVPGATDDACIDTPFAGTTVTLSNSNVIVHSLTAASTFALTNTSTSTTTSLAVTINSVFLNALTLNNATLTSAANLALDGPFTSSGTSTIGGTTGVRANGGMTVLNGTLNITGTLFQNFGPAVINPQNVGATVNLASGTEFDNSSTLSMSSVTISGPSAKLVNLTGGTINVTGSNSLVSVPVLNTGTVTVITGRLTLTGGFTQQGGATNLQNGGSISSSTPISMTTGFLNGNGTVIGGATIAGGIISPGFSPGTISVVGPYAQTATGTYNAEIGGRVAGTQYDQVVAATAALNGTLNVSLINGFVPVAGDSFTILTCNGTAPCRTGTFSAVNFPALSSGLAWNIIYGPSSVMLTVGTAAAGTCAAGTNQWTGLAGDGQWGTAGNWTGTGGGSAVPGSSDSACIGSAFSASTITIGALAAANQTIAGLNSSAQISVTSGPLTVVGPATFVGSVFLSGGTLTLNGTSSTQALLELTTGSTLGGTGTLTASGTLSWSGGTISGAGILNANGGIGISGGSLFLNARQLNVSGATSFGNADQGGTLLLQNGAVINNLAGATWSLVNGVAGNGIVLNGGTTGTFNNAGTLQMTGGTANQISVVFNNTGTVKANTGTLTFNASGTESGPFNVASGATLAFTASTFNFNSGTTIAGAGMTSISTNANFNVGSSLTTATTISGGTTTLATGSTVTIPSLNLSGGTLTGPGTLTSTGLLTWTGGTMTGTGVTTANGGMSISPVSLFLDNRTLNVSGATTFGSTTAGSTLFLQNGAVINNLAGSTWTLLSGTNGNGILLNGATTGTFNNAGTLQMTGGTDNTVSVAFNNTGTVNANAVTLTLSGSGTGAGTFNVASGATLGFAGGTFALGGSVAGAGAVSFSGGTANLTGTYNISGGTTVSGGTANFTGTLTTAGALTIGGGTANFSNTGGAVTASSLGLSGGTLTGTSIVTVSGPVTWTGGTMSGTGVTNANGLMSIQGSLFLDTRMLNVSGATTFGSTTAGSTLFLQNGAVINNLAGSPWTLISGTNGNGILLNGATTGTFSNAGTFQMTGGTANTVNVTFNNTGTVNANAGTLNFGGGGTVGANYNVASGATLGFTGGTFVFNAGTAISGAGTTNLGTAVNVNGNANIATALSITAGTTTLASGVTLSLSTLTLSAALTGAGNVTVSGPLTWTGGTMSGTGVTNANGGMSIPSGQMFLDARTLNVSGATAFGTAGGGGVNFFMQNAAVVNNLAAATWSILSGNGNGIFLNGGTTGTFNNAGTFQMTGGTADTVSVQFNNTGTTGTVNANAGTLTLSGGGSGAGTFNVAGGATLGFGGGAFALSGSIAGAGAVSFAVGTANLTGTYNISGGTTVSSGTANFTGTLTTAGALTINGGTANFSNTGGAVTASSLTLSGGTLTGSSNVTVAAGGAAPTLTWTSGTMSGTGVTSANGGMSIQGTPFLDARTLNVSGPTTFGSTTAGSTLFLMNGALINSQTGATWSLINGSGGNGITLNGGTTGTFNNAGTFQMTGGTANTVNVTFNNTGTVNANAGTLNFGGGGTVGANYNVASGATLGFTGGTFIFNAGTAISGAGTTNLATTVNVNGNANIASALSITGGTTTLASGVTLSLSSLTLNVGTLTGAGNLTVSGLLTWTAGLMSGTGVTNANGGMSIATGGQSVFLDTRTLNVSGTTTFGSTAFGTALLLQNAAIINNQAGSTWSVVAGSGNGNAIRLNSATGTFNNAGTFQSTASASDNVVTVTFNNAGTVTSSAGTLDFNGVYTQTSGVLSGSIGTNSTLNINGGALSGGGILGNVSVTTGGVLRGSNSIIGNYTQSATGSYLVQFAGVSATQTDILRVENGFTATLGGTLNVGLLNGFVPAAGNSFLIVSCQPAFACIKGTFATTNFPVLPGGLGWNITYSPTDVMLSVVTATGPDLAVTNTASVASTHLGGGNFTYTVTATNTGSAGATGVTITDTLPGNVNFVSVAPTGVCTGTTTLTCAIGNLASGLPSTVIITVNPIAVGAATNSATVTPTDPTPADNTATATVQILASADLSLTKTANPATSVNAGSNLTYTLAVTNLGPNTATGVTVTDPIPAGATLVSAEPSQGTCTLGATVTCALGTIPVSTAPVNVLIVVTPAGGVGTTQLANTASVTANEFDPNTANDTSTATVSVVPVADVAITQSASPNPGVVGSNLTFTLSVTNNGPSSATGVTLTDPLPTPLTFVSATPSTGTCPTPTTILSCALGTLAKGATATVTLVVKPTGTGTVANTATVAANETDPNPANNTFTLSVPIVASADLAVAMTAAPPTQLLGASNITYTITTGNNGPSPATNVILTDTLPAGVTLVSTISGADSSCNTTALPTITCPLLSISSGASVTTTIVVKPNAAGTFTNSARVAGTEPDPNPANNSASASAVVNPVADLSLAETAAPPTVSAGNNVTFSFTVTNAGPSPATDVTISDALPAGLTLVSATPSQGSCTALPCNLGNVATGASATLTVVAKALAAGNFTNTGTVSATEFDPNAANNTASAPFTVLASADLAISITSAPAAPVVGLNLTFTVKVINNGPSPATGVTVSNPVPPGTSLVSATPSQGPACSPAVSCAIGNLASGASATVAIVLTPQVAGNLSDTATVFGNEPDPNQANNTQTITVNVINHPTVNLAPGSVNFASQPVGTSSASQPVVLTNQSPVLPVTGLVIAASGDFSETDNCGTGLAPTASCTINITFKPTATGTRTGTLTLTDNAVGSPQSVSLTGLGINAPAISLVPASLTFSSQRVGSQSTSQPVTMTNTGNAILNISSITITGADPSDFSQTNTCSSTLAAGSTCTINVSFKPTAGGQRTAGISISSDARGSVPVVTLSGTGVAPGLDLSPSLLIFNNQIVGSTSAAQPVFVSNSAATAVAISSIAATGDFAETDNCGTSLAANSNCTIQVTFKPTATGTRTGSLNVTASDSGTAHNVQLSGTGVVVTLTLTPSSLTFNNQKTGTTSQSQPITLTNTGGATLTIDSIVPSGDFLETNNCGSSVAASASCIINVTFTPTTTGTRTGTITVNSNAQGSPQTASLTGTGVATGPAVSLTCPSGSSTAIVRRGQAVATVCTTLSFSSQAVGTTSAAQTVVVSNVGNDVLNIGPQSPATTGDFAISSNVCTSTLAAGASCNISLTFTPTATGARVGALTIQDNAGDSPQSVILTGTGTPSGPAASLSASALPFGNQMVGTASAAQSVTITNTGNAALSFTSVTVSGDFTKANDTCTNASVAPNASCAISVTFAPTTTGGRAGAITISDNAPDSPQSVTLSGNGTDISISLPPGSSSSASVSAGQSASFSLMIAPGGGFNGPVTVACNGAIPGGTCTSSPSSFTLNSVVTVTTTVTTTKASPALVVPSPIGQPGNLDPLRILLQSLLTLAILFALALAARRGREASAVVRLRFRRAWALAATGILLVALSSSLSGCAGGSGNPGVIGPTPGTPVGTYHLTVVVTTASGATRSFPLTINVQ